MPTLPNKREKTAIRQTNEDPTFDILHRHLDDPNKYESRKFMKTVENNAILTILKSKQQRTRVKLKRRILNFEGKNECQRYFRRSWHSTWSFGCFPNEFKSKLAAAADSPEKANIEDQPLKNEFGSKTAWKRRNEAFHFCQNPRQICRRNIWKNHSCNLYKIKTTF